MADMREAKEELPSSLLCLGQALNKDNGRHA
jgi:hypothetical protein